MVIHEALLAAAQPQAVWVVTVTVVPVPAASRTLWLVGLITYEHPGSCVTVNVWSAIVIVPVRVAATVFSAYVHPTLPLPTPDVGDWTIIHDALLVAVQPHDA